ncbi:MAG: tRNA (adenosine(37)-N6)-dimethylallyltransferase MiaA [Bacteroidetes bacterium]|nr:tRNA (adenosine(37)-N6)-dimethylallyltransferase MiaA [Bacteroidota bacterium]
MKLPVLFLVGPTASGKSSLAFELAKATGAEIVSSDSRQIYKHMTIGTAAPSLHELECVQHHFVGELEPDQPFSAFDFFREGRKRISEILERGKPVVVAGGSGLYFSALKNGISDIPADTEVRDKLLIRLENEGREKLFEELKAIDPQAAQSRDSTKTQRVIRALEVWYASGKTMTWWQQHDKPEPFPFPYLCAGLAPEREDLYNRINSRVLDMVKAGLKNEVQFLLEKGFTSQTNALKTVGYEEYFPFFRGEYDENRAIELVQRNTRHYAKRQMTWFKKDSDVVWFNPSDPETSEKVLKFWMG